MSWMVYSFGNRYSWFGPVDLYMHVETILSSYNYKLKHIENYGGSFFDYFITTGEYIEEVLDAIETALGDEFLDREIEGELIVLKRVFKGGRVIMG
jgi:hypothetical protein